MIIVKFFLSFILFSFLAKNNFAQEIGTIKVGKYYNEETLMLEGEGNSFNQKSICFVFSTYFGTFNERTLMLRVIKIESNSEFIYESSNYDVEPDWSVTWDKLTLPIGEYKIKFYNDEGDLIARSSKFTILSEYYDNQNSSTLNYLENQLYFVEEYTQDGEEIGRSTKYYIKRNGGYITAMLRTAKPIGVNSVDLKLELENSYGTELIDVQPYDVTSSKSYFFFDKITFYKPGNYILTIYRQNGTIIASGKVQIALDD